MILTTLPPVMSEIGIAKMCHSVFELKHTISIMLQRQYLLFLINMLYQSLTS